MALNKPCIILLIIISGMERFAFKGVASNLVTYLTDVMGMSNSSAAKFVNNWVGFTSMLPLIVATLADSYWDRYSTILASSVLYAAGLLALTSTSVRWPWEKSSNKLSSHSIASLSWCLYMISLGQGGYNPSLQAFGADQLVNQDDLPRTNNNVDEKSAADKKRLFFQWWYFGVCSGSLLGYSVMSYIQDTFGWGLGFAIPTLSMVASILMFLCGNRFYERKGSRVEDGKSIEDIVRAVKASFCKMIKGGNGNGSLDNIEYTKVELELQEKASLCNQDEETSNINTSSQGRHHLIEALKIASGLLPVWAMLLMFAVIFQQPATFFTKQGMTMQRNIGPNFKIPPAALQSAITISILLLMPWYDAVFIPFVRLLTRNDKGISVMQRIGIGMFLSVVAMIIAAVTEKRRLDAIEKGNMLSIFWLLPQYVLLGISDIFTVVGMQEFFYSEVPVRMRTMGIALYTSVFGCGSFLSAFLISGIEYLTSEERGGGGNWFADDMAQARLDKYYWFLAMSSGVSLLAFLIFCRFFKRKEGN